MPVPVKIILSKRELLPPVYLAGSFTGWEPSLNMDVETRTDETGSWNEFYKVVDLEPGSHEYKFRLGDGEWWVADDAVPQVADGLGNSNNIITVSEPPKSQPTETTVEQESNVVPKSDKEDQVTLRSSESKSIPDTSGSSNVTIVETSPILNGNPSGTKRQDIKDQAVGAQNQERSGVEEVQASTDTPTPSKQSNTQNTVSKKTDYLSRLFCFCSTHKALGVTGGVLVLAAYIVLF